MGVKIECDGPGRTHGIETDSECFCKDCYDQLLAEKEEAEDRVKALEQELEELQTSYDKLEEKYNHPVEKFARGEYKEDETFQCRTCKNTFRVKEFTTEMVERQQCPQCYTKEMTGDKKA